jgi:hypothetical protein
VTVEQTRDAIVARVRRPGVVVPSADEITAWAREMSACARTAADHAFVADLYRTAAGTQAIERGDWKAAEEAMRP